MDYTKEELVTTTYNVFKEGNTDMFDKYGKSKQNFVKEAITPPISEKKEIDTVNKTEKPHESNKTVDTSKSNETGTVKSLDKSRSTQRTDTENTVDKSMCIPRSNYSSRSTRIEKLL